MKKINDIKTPNMYLCEKINLLNLSNQVVIDKKKYRRVNELVSRLNKKGNMVRKVDIGDKVILQKINPFRVSAVLTKRGI